MGITGYTAMTAAEFHNAAQLPAHVAWMACHFSCYGTGLTNLPPQLPENAMVIINDRTPVQGHDPEVIVQQLVDLYEALHPTCFLLDLQRPHNRETQTIAEVLTKSLPCPVGVSSCYAVGLDCPVFLPPPEIDCPLQTHLQAWTGREIWLEMAEDVQTATVTETGCTFAPSAPDTTEEGFLFDEQVFCHYRVNCGLDKAVIQLQRTKNALQKMLAYADQLGIPLAVGLYQQLGADFFNKDTLRT